VCGQTIELLNVKPGGTYSIQTRIRIKVDISLSSTIPLQRVKKYCMCCATKNWQQTLSSPRKMCDPGKLCLMKQKKSKVTSTSRFGFQNMRGAILNPNMLLAFIRATVSDRLLGSKQARHSDTCIISSSLQLPLLRR